MLLYLVIYLLPLPAQPCGWCIRTRRVGRHHPRRLDLSLSLDTHSLSLQLPPPFHLHPLSPPQHYLSPLLITLPGASAFNSCAQNPNTG